MKRLAWLVVGGVVVAVACSVFFPALLTGPSFRVVKAVLAGLTATSAVRVGLAFGPGEHLRRAWSLLALDYGLLGVAQVVAMVDLPLAVHVTMTILINGAGIAATSYFARAHALAGLDLPGSRARQRAVFATAAVLALLLVGVPFVETLHRLQSGNLRVLIITVSSIGDLVTFTLIGPILLTAVALRGGLLLWPWAFLVGSNIAWFCQDAAAVGEVIWPALTEDSILVWTNLWQVLACFLAFAAAVAQRRVSSVTVEMKSEMKSDPR